MKKALLPLTVLFGFSSFANASDVPQICENYFKLAEEWLQIQGQQPKEVQAEALKVVRSQFTELPKEQMEPACTMALDEIKKALGK